MKYKTVSQSTFFFLTIQNLSNETDICNRHNPSLAEHDMPLANNVDPDQLASEKPTDLDLHCLSLNM